MIFTATIERHENIRKALADLREVKLSFEHQGSLIIFCSQLNGKSTF